MLRVVFLIMIAIAFLSCDYLTDETETETETETSPIAPAPVNWEALLQDRGNWTLLAILDRDVRQKYWHEFYVQPDTEALLLQAYKDGKEFLFVIEKTKGLPSTQPIQFYFPQPEGFRAWRNDDHRGRPLTARVDLFYPSPPYWFDHWGDYEIQPEITGFVAVFDAGFPGWKFETTDDWVLGSVEFRASRHGASFATTYPPHIKEGYVLKIFAR